jgi:hypothetical protein
MTERERFEKQFSNGLTRALNMADLNHAFHRVERCCTPVPKGKIDVWDDKELDAGKYNGPKGDQNV